MWTKAQVAKAQKALAASDVFLPKVEHFEEIAKHAPQFADRVAALRTRADGVKTLASVMLTIDAVGK